MRGRCAAVILVLVIIAAGGACAWAAEPSPEPQAPPACHALLVGSMPGGERFARHYRDWLTRFHVYLTQKAGVSAANIAVLTGDEGFKGGVVTGPARAESVLAALAALAAKARPQDQVIVVFIGHGVLTDRVPTLVLPGEDLDFERIAKALSAATAKNQVILNLCSSGGASVKMLAAEGRVIVTASGPTEGNEPVMPEFFLRGLESGRADGEGAPAAGAKDGRITLLEAYNWAAHQTAQWIARLTIQEDGAWRVDGRESVEVFEKLYGAGGPFRLAASSNRSRDDAPVAVVPEGGKLTAEWLARRVLSEHATLEDCGQEEGVAAVSRTGYAPVAGRDAGRPGSLARRVVLGRPDLLPADEPPAEKP